MNFWPADETSTRTFARVLGPYYVIVCGSGLVHKQSSLPLLSDIGVWPWATGAPILMLGLVVIVLHPFWRNVTAAIISVMGWSMALRGFALLAFPGTTASVVDAVTGARAHLTIYIVLGVLGLYLTYAGWGRANLRRRSAGAPGASSHSGDPGATS